MSEMKRKGELEATRQTIQFFEAVLRASADGVVITDASQNIILVNEAFCRFLGTRPRDVVETNLCTWLEHAHMDAPSRWAELEGRVHRQGRSLNADFQFSFNNKQRCLRVNASELDRVAGQDRGIIISIWRDITEQKQAEEELAEHREHLEERVHDRTEELRSIIKSMVGRENRMVGLKEVIKKLRAQLEEAGMTPVSKE